MVEVFKTDVKNKKQAKMILSKLSIEFPSFRINFDLEDCDKILRIEGSSINSKLIVASLKSENYFCEVLA